MFESKKIEAAQSRMEAKRSQFDTLYREIGSLLLPAMGHVNGQFSNQGQSRTDNIFDEYAQLALEDGIAAFEAFIMPRGQRWQKLKLADDALMEKIANRQWLEKIELRLFALRNDPKSGFTTQTHESAASLMGFGTQSMWADLRRDPMGRIVGLSYQSEHFAGIYVENDAEGYPMRIHRKVMLTAEAAQRKFGSDSPPKVVEAMTGTNPRPDEEFEFIHVIEPNERMDPERIDAMGKPWKSCYYSCKDKMYFRAGGYRTLPRTVSRFIKSSNEDYGRSRAMMVLPSVRAAQLMMQDRVLGAEFAAKPPLLAHDDMLDETIAYRPWGVTYGALDERGNPMLRKMLESVDMSGAETLHSECRAMIDRAFYRDLFQIFKEQKTHISATRTMEEVAEKGILLSPLARQEDEWLSRMLDREIDLMGEMGLLDDMPAELAEYFASGGGLDVRYDNLLAKMQEAGAVVGYVRTAEQVNLFAQYDPSVVKMFMREYPFAKVLPKLGELNGIPALWQATDDEKSAFDEQEAAEIDQQRLLEAVPALSNAARDLSMAGASNGG